MNNKNAYVSIVIVFLLLVSPAFAKNDKKPPRLIKQKIGDLACPNGHIAKFNQSLNVWECAEDIDTNDGDTLADLSCTADQIAKHNGNGWECAEDEQGSDSGSPQWVVTDGDEDVMGPAVLYSDPTGTQLEMDLVGFKVLMQISSFYDFATETYSYFLDPVSETSVYDVADLHAESDCSDGPYVLTSISTSLGLVHGRYDMPTFLSHFNPDASPANTYDLVELTGLGVPVTLRFRSSFDGTSDVCSLAGEFETLTYNILKPF